MIGERRNHLPLKIMGLTSDSTSYAAAVSGDASYIAAGWSPVWKVLTNEVRNLLSNTG